VVAHPLVEAHGSFEARRGDPGDALGGGAQGVVRTAGVDPFGRVRHVELAPGSQARLLQQRHEPLAGGTGVGGGLEHHELTGAQHACQGGPRRHERAEVGLPVAGERRGHCDEHRVGVGQILVATGGVQEVPGRAKAVVRHVLDVTLAP
jgi:hypothetical protein